MHDQTGQTRQHWELGGLKTKPHRHSSLTSQAERGEDYAAMLQPLLDEPWILGWHWCGYVENTARGWELKDPWDEPYSDLISTVAAFNHQAVVPRPR